MTDLIPTAIAIVEPPDALSAEQMEQVVREICDAMERRMIEAFPLIFGTRDAGTD